MGNTKSVTGGANNLCRTLPYSYIFSGSYVVNLIFYFERKGRQHYFVFCSKCFDHIEYWSFGSCGH